MFRSIRSLAACPALARVAPVFALAALAPVTGALAQAYPTKPVRVLIPFAAGGAVDTVGRLVSGKLTDAWKQPVVVENRPGAGGLIAADQVAKAAPDGQTLLLGTIALAVTPSTYRKLPYDPAKDLVPLTQITAHALVLTVNAKTGVNSVQELVALSKAKRGTLSYGTTGTGTSNHLLTELLNLTTGTDLLHVPYKGDAPAVAALIANEVQVALMPAIGVVPHAQAGRVKPLGVTGTKRTSVLPDVPTMGEAGVPGFEAPSWMGFFSPAGLSREIATKIQGDTARVLQMPDVREKFAREGFEPIGNTPAEFRERFLADWATYARVVKEAKIPPQD